MDIQSALLQYQGSDGITTCCGISLNEFILFPASTILTTFPEIPQKIKNLPDNEICTENLLDISPKNTTVQQKTKYDRLSLSPVEFVALLSYRCVKETKSLPLSCQKYQNGEVVEINSLLSLYVIGRTSNEGSVKDFLNELSKIATIPEKLRDVYIEATLFGNVELLGSISKGIVCACFGVNDCYFVTDATTGPGCEGAPVYSLERSSG